MLRSGADHSRPNLFPDCVDDWIDSDDPGRVVDAFFDALEFAPPKLVGVIPATSGRPSRRHALSLELYA